jgi:hypothetical protein
MAYKRPGNVEVKIVNQIDEKTTPVQGTGGRFRRPLAISLLGAILALLPAAYLLVWELLPKEAWVGQLPLSFPAALLLVGLGAACSVGAAVWGLLRLINPVGTKLKFSQFAAFFLTIAISAIGFGLGVGFVLFEAGWRV